MITVDLRTADDGLVAQVELPPFQTMPEVLIWGRRVFVYERVRVYKEAFACWVPIFGSGEPPAAKEG